MAAFIQGRNSGRKHRKLMSEINITPMVDVMLVLLVIFMVTSPMLVAGIEVDLPKTEASPISGNEQPLVISIKKKGEVFLFETMISENNLVEKLKEVTKENKDARIFVKGDKDVHYGKIVEVMSSVQNAGFTRVALISDIKHK